MRDIEEIYQELRDAFGGRAGFVPEDSCDLAVRLWAAAAQIQALGTQAEWVLDQSFPQTAQGIYLDRHAAMRGLARTPATRAAGVLRFRVDTAPVADLTIPADTVCMTADEVRFRTTEAAVLAAGTLSADAVAEALDDLYRLSCEVGAEMTMLHAHDAHKAICAFCRERGVTRLVLGQARDGSSAFVTSLMRALPQVSFIMEPT